QSQFDWVGYPPEDYRNAETTLAGGSNCTRPRHKNDRRSYRGNVDREEHRVRVRPELVHRRRLGWVASFRGARAFDVVGRQFQIATLDVPKGCECLQQAAPLLLRQVGWVISN